jgi:hypothetical protein
MYSFPVSKIEAAVMKGDNESANFLLSWSEHIVVLFMTNFTVD